PVQAVGAAERTEGRGGRVAVATGRLAGAVGHVGPHLAWRDPQRGPGRPGRVIRRAWALALLVPLLVTTPLAWFALSTDGRRTTADRADARPVALVLGAGLRRDGYPSMLLARRLDIAADLYHRGTVDAVLVS